MNEEFDILTVKILAGEASAEERARLDELLSKNSELARDFNGLQESWNAIRELGPLADALAAPPASPPPERLSRFQELVRAKFESANTDSIETVAQDEVSPAHGTREAATPRRAHPVQPENASEGAATLAAIKHWLREKCGLSALSASIGLVALALLTGVTLFSRRSPEAQSTAADPDRVVAYLMSDQGELEVRRGSKPIALGPATPLRGADEVLLATGTKAHLLTAAGALELVGPKRLSAGDAAATRKATQGAKASATTALETALFKPAKEILAAGLLAATRSSGSIPLYSPLGSTANLKPLILWKSEPRKTYEITITDEFDPKAPPMRLSAVVPPVDFAMVEAWRGQTLATDGLYRIRLSETGNPLSVSEYTFRTIKEDDHASPTAPGDKLLRAYRILSAKPSQVGDALADLLTLPPVFAESELALRLKLYVFGQQGYREDFQTLSAKLDAGDPRR